MARLAVSLPIQAPDRGRAGKCYSTAQLTHCFWSGFPTESLAASCRRRPPRALIDGGGIASSGRDIASQAGRHRGCCCVIRPRASSTSQPATPRRPSCYLACMAAAVDRSSARHAAIAFIPHTAGARERNSDIGLVSPDGVARVLGREGVSEKDRKAPRRGFTSADPTGEKARAVKARYVGVCRGRGAYTQPRNGYVPRHISAVLFPTGLCGR
jgi:hypothetical protein